MTARKSSKRITADKKTHMLTPSFIGTVLLLVFGTSCAGQSPSKTSDLASEKLAAEDTVRAGNCDQAVDMLSQVITADPADLAARRSRASCYLTLHRYTPAIADLRVIANTSSDAEAYINLAQALWSAGQAEPAREALRSSAARTSDPHQTLQIGEFLISFGDSSAARSVLMTVPVASRDYRWFLQLGKIDASLGDPRPFESDFKQALQVAPDDARDEILVTLADSRWSRGEYISALASYRQALGGPIPVARFHVYSQMADCDIHLGRLNQAAEDYRAGLAADDLTQSVEVDLSLGLASVLVKLHSYAEATPILRDLLSRRNLSATAAQQARALQALISSGG